MEDEDIDYDITFPSPVAPDSASDVGVCETRLFDKREPVVILLGWLGCQEKHIAKYGQIYDQKGCITVRYTAPREVTIFNMCKLRNIAFKLLDLLNDYYIQENPIFFHIFSNNGSFVYSNAVKVLFGGDARFQDFQVCGVVIDSAPGKPRLLSAARALSSSQQAGTFKYYIAMLAMVFYLIFKYAKAWLLATYDRNHKQNDEYFLYDTMKNDQSRWPQMYLYSIADKVISFSDVEEMVEHREKLGVHVDSMCWEDSQHVCHYRCYPEQYRQACWDFLSFCLDTLESAADSDALEETDDYLLIRNK